MASHIIRQRAETALEYAKDLLLDDENEDEDDTFEDDENESENCGKEKDCAADGKPEAEDEKGKEPKSDKDPKGKKSSKGMAKKAKRLMNIVMDPFGSKFQWKINFNLGVNASNQKEQQEGKTDQNAGTSGAKAQTTPDKKRDDESSSPDAKKIKSLEKDNKELQKLASKFLDGCIRLETKMSELAKMERQCYELQADNDRLKGELRDVQQLQQGLASSLESQSEKHRNEVKRFETELKHATDSLQQIKLTHQNQVEESCRLRKDLESVSKTKENLINQLEQKEKSYLTELTKLKDSIQQATTGNTELTDRVHKLSDDLQTTAEQIKELKVQNMELQHALSETENEKQRINLRLDASNAKIVELKRAIQILESNPFTTTAAQMQNDGAYSCPLCGVQFDSLANMQLHAEDCNG
ncbi:optineurin-like [Anopheles marshallii]|uniref:optineurin-like n=1 Tax=Anopheles marshallii TaxID=1521116 RepID=UPI00237C3E35|nr:optineurin-like [Anopheles marshallii]